MDDLSLADLKVFARTAALGSLSAVARERGVPVSQVSRAIDRMELACGGALLRRSVRGVTLTDEGEKFLQFCSRVGMGSAELEEDFAQRKNGVAGRVRLGLSAVVAQYWVVPSLPVLARRHRQLLIDLDVDDGMVDLARDGVDVAIRTGTLSALSVVAQPLGTIATALYASRGYLARHGVPASVDDLRRHALLANCAHPVLNRLVFTKGRAMIADGPLRSASTAVIAQMAQHGLGLAHLPVRVAQGTGAVDALVPVLPADVVSAEVPVHAIALADSRRSLRARALVAHLKEVFRSPAPLS